jgi:predicted enzyme related to lactoylglutathione lyase
VVYFEIPVNDIDRAMIFYQKVFGFQFERTSIDGNEMAMFPNVEDGFGISGALAKGDSY